MTNHLLELLDGESAPARVTLTQPDLTVRASTAAPGQGRADRLQEALNTLNEELRWRGGGR